MAGRLGRGTARQHGHAVEIVVISTSGDRHFGAIDRQAGRGLFTKEIQERLLRGEVDLTVHSLKDLPTEPVPGLRLAAVPARARAGDALLSVDFPSLEALPSGAIVGTGSLRRRAQLLHVRPDLEMADLRGNVDTRIRKLKEGQYAAIVLAQAGLDRLGFDAEIRQRLPLNVMLPAPGQAALGIEARADDTRAAAALQTIDERAAHAAVIAERAPVGRARRRLPRPDRGLCRVRRRNARAARPRLERRRPPAARRPRDRRARRRRVPRSPRGRRSSHPRRRRADRRLPRVVSQRPVGGMSQIAAGSPGTSSETTPDAVLRPPARLETDQRSRSLYLSGGSSPLPKTSLSSSSVR